MKHYDVLTLRWSIITRSDSGADVFRDWSELGGDFHHKFESLAADAEELVKDSASVADKARREGMN